MLRKRSRPGRHQADIQQAIFSVEALETRTLLSVSINAGTVVSSVPTDFEGINTAPWDNALSPLSTNGSQTLSLSEAAGINGVRLGGGSYVDGSSSVVSGKTVITTGWHFNVNNQSTTIGQMAEYAADLGANAIVDVNYGTGSPEEAVALWAYLNGNPNDTTSIASLFGNNAGDSEQWSTSSQTWVSENWQTVGYWASLRAATPLATDDGLNFLRLNGNGTTTINHPAAFNFTNWEIGNEVYGSWEIDEHGVATDTLPMPIENGTQTKAKAHDPTTIISFAKQFQTAINAILADGMESTQVRSPLASIARRWTPRPITGLPKFFNKASPRVSPSAISPTTITPR